MSEEKHTLVILLDEFDGNNMWLLERSQEFVEEYSELEDADQHVIVAPNSNGDGVTLSLAFAKSQKIDDDEDWKAEFFNYMSQQHRWNYDGEFLMKMETLEFIVPVMFISALAYDDESGMSDEDSEALRVFSESIPEGFVTWEYPDNIDEVKYFSNTNDVTNYADNVVQLKLHKF